MPYPAGLAGLQIVAQAAYAEPWTRRLQLTVATSSLVPEQPGGYSFRRVFYVAQSLAAGTGEFMHHEHQPVFRFLFQ